MPPIAWLALGMLLPVFGCGGGDASPAVAPVPTPAMPWQLAAAFPGGGLQGPAAFGLASQAVVVGGMNGNAFSKEVYRFSGSPAAWTRLADFPGTPRVDANAFAVNGQGYLLFGWTRTWENLRELWAYDPAKDIWTRKADFPGSERQLAVTLAIGGKVYVVGGGLKAKPSPEVWMYDPATDAWTRRKDFPGEAVSCAAGFVIGSRGYVGTGATAGEGFAAVRAFWAYDPSNDTWTRKADFPGVARGYALAFELAGKGFLGLGTATVSRPMQTAQDVWAYDPTADAWTRQTDYPGAGRSMAVGFTLGGVAYLGLGNDANQQGLREGWTFTPR